MVGRNGYVSLQFGQQRPFEPGRPLVITDGQVLDRIDFALPRGSVIRAASPMNSASRWQAFACRQ